MKRYPFIEFMAAKGRRLATVVGLLIAIVAIATFVLIGPSLWVPLGMAGLAAISYLVIRLVSELIEVIADTLMPR
jgi:hypothetical protein